MKKMFIFLCLVAFQSLKIICSERKLINPLEEAISRKKELRLYQQKLRDKLRHRSEEEELKDRLRNMVRQNFYLIELLMRGVGLMKKEALSEISEKRWEELTALEPYYKRFEEIHDEVCTEIREEQLLAIQMKKNMIR